MLIPRSSEQDVLLQHIYSSSFLSISILGSRDQDFGSVDQARVITSPLRVNHVNSRHVKYPEYLNQKYIHIVHVCLHLGVHVHIHVNSREYSRRGCGQIVVIATCRKLRCRALLTTDFGRG